jgi:predicted TIM-barrel fold metal-dependent hydrolase
MTAIVDAHHHIWRRRDLPWLVGPMQPRIFGAYEPIRRDYPISEYLADIAGCEVARSVYVQANWAKDCFEDEVAFVQRAADETGYPTGIVGYADFLTDDVRAQLDRLSAYRNMRGLRMQLHWHKNPQYRFATKPDLASDPNLQRNVARLADYGWSFDLQVFTNQMRGAAELATSCSNVTFILQHAGMLEDLSVSGRARWFAAMRRLALCPNVVSKLSGLGTFIHRNDAGHIATIVNDCIAIFGPSRCLFGSNFPIEKLWTSYTDLVAAHRRALVPLGEVATRAVLHDTALRVYRLS